MTNREEFKKLVIMGNHPGKTYGEALLLEAVFGCIIEYKDKSSSITYNRIASFSKDKKFISFSRNDDYENCFININNNFKNVKILGLPITIGRVMQALRNKRIEYGKSVNGEFNNNMIKLCNIWQFPDFKKYKNGKECTDDDQTDETINPLINLLCKPN